MRWCIFFLLVLAGCQGSSKPKPPPPNVIAGVVEQRDVLIYVDAIGQAIPPVTVQVRPQVNGKLIAAYIQQGSIVERGTIRRERDEVAYVVVVLNRDGLPVLRRKVAGAGPARYEYVAVSIDTNAGRLSEAISAEDG